MTSIKTNQRPYFDDYDETKGYHKILFVPKNSVQARELNQLQTILQTQIDRFGQHIFSPNTKVLGGDIDFDTKFQWINVTVASNSNLSSSSWRETNLHDKVIVKDPDSGIKALVISSTAPDSSNYVKLFIKYISNDTATGVVSVFSASQAVKVDGTDIVMSLPSTNSSGVGSVATIKSGVYFVRGYFVRVESQVIILSETDDTPSCKVGLSIVEGVVTSAEDISLLSNAQGTPNYTAPGADRLKIELILTKKDFSSISNEDFLELLVLEDGLVKLKKINTEYAKIGDELARRTYDESGDYTVKPWIAEVKDHPSDSTKLRVSINPGKGYIRGYEIETIGNTFVDVDRARDTQYVNNNIIRTPLGNYCFVTNVYKLPDISTYITVNLRDDRTATRGTGAGSVIGTAKARAVQYESGTIFGGVAGAGGTAIYRLYLFDISMNTGKAFEQVKQITHTTAANFTCDISLSTFLLDGLITSSSTTITGQGTFFSSRETQRLVSGDFIKDNTSGKIYKLNGNPASDISLTVTSAPSPAISVGTTFSYVYAELYESSNNKLIFPIPDLFIKTVRDSVGNVDTNYNTYRIFTGQTVSSGKIVLAAGASESFVSFSSQDYILTLTTDNANATYDVGDIVPTSASQYTIAGTTCEINGLNNGDVYTVIATVRKTGGSASQEKTKSLVVDFSNTASGSGVNDLKIFTLQKCDVYRLKAIYMSPDFTTAPTTAHTNITSRYDLDSGQRDNYYGLGRVVLKSGSTAPTGRILVVYDYFTHSANGNYFSVNSYSTVGYSDIPAYVSPESGDTYELRDCLDFRPTVNSTGTAFDNSTGSLTHVMKGDVSADYQYYLNRIDKLYIDYRGNFNIIKGTSGIVPSLPSDPDDGMVIYKLSVQAYTLDKTKLYIDFVDNKRYTMKDISKLETRIDNLEKYTLLTLLEKEADDLLIQDADGFDQFKNGFIVDPFNGHQIGDVKSPDYNCAIDMTAGQMRPEFYQGFFSFLEENTTDLDRTADGYKKTGDLLTLPYSNVPMIEQLVSSSTININPYAVFSFLGSIGLVPPNDEWKDTAVLPDLVVNQDGDYDTMLEKANAFGTIWNEWERNWTGSEQSKTKTTKVVASGNNAPDKQHNQNWPLEKTTTIRTTTTKTGTSTRSGQKMSVVPRTILQDFGDRVVSVNYIPYIRSREVQIKGKGFKPNTRLYPFFDGVDVSAYVTAWSDPDVYEAFNAGDIVSTGTKLISDARGNVSGSFLIPSSMFKTGERVLKLTDRPANDQNFTTSGEAYYRAQGLLETKQKTILATRNGEIVPETVIESKAISSTSTEVEKKVKWIDPLAQSFLVTEAGGTFVTSIDLFFQTKDANIPVIVQIREMINGSPSQRLLPFGEIYINASDIHTNEVSNGVLSIDGIATTNSPVSSNFLKTTATFSSPVYLQEGFEYCFVVLSNSNAYQVWKSTMGETMIGTELPIAEQPYAGTLFKSQNASTWTPEQDSDLMFRINKARFDISSTGIVTFTNQQLPLSALTNDPFSTKNGSNTVRVYHKNHGMTTGGSVTLAGTTVNVNGIPFAELNATKVIANVELDYYTITTTSNASSTGSSGGSTVTASSNRHFNNLKTIVSDLILPNTQIFYGIKTTSGKSVHGTESAFVLDTSYSDCSANQTIDFATPRIVASQINETTNMAGSKSFFFRGTLYSTNENVSPVIDLSRTSAITIANRIDSPNGIGSTNNINTAFDTTILVTNSSNIAFSASTITCNNAAQALALSVVKAGNYITVTDASNAGNNATWLVKKVVHTEGVSTTIEVEGTLVTESAGASSTVDITHLSRFVSSTAPVGSSTSSKYIHKRMNLTNPANSLKVTVIANRPSLASIDIYYKILPVGSVENFDDRPWVLLSPESTVPPSEKASDFREYNYKGLNIGDFTSISTKIVMKSTNSSQVPIVEDLKVIAYTA